ncbi:MAG: hypothetical protein KDB01_17360 [Planctomycetaceae bacterium]|nr:hypothetical protein [Planctomycetaceae bacterium]
MNAVAQRTPDLPLVIIAGTYQQALRWVDREGSERFFIAMDGASIVSLRNVRVVWIGTFWERDDFLTISEDVDAMVAAGMCVVDRNEIVNKGRQARKKTEP